MTAETPARPGGDALLVAAAAGDEQAFWLLTEPHRRALHLHCHRMLASVHDADDALQETLLRAWRALGRFEPRSAPSAWLHAIATNVCLTALARRARRRELPAADVGEAVWEERLLHLQPYPDRLLNELEPASTDPEARDVLRKQRACAAAGAGEPRAGAAARSRDAHPGGRRAGSSPARALHGGLGRGRHRRDREAAHPRRAHDDAARADVRPRRPRDRGVLRHRPARGTPGRDPPRARGGQPPAGARRLRARAGRRRPRVRRHGLACDGDAISGIVGFADASLVERFGLPLELEA